MPVGRSNICSIVNARAEVAYLAHASVGVPFRVRPAQILQSIAPGRALLPMALTENNDHGLLSEPLGARAGRCVLDDPVLGLELVADFVGTLEVFCFARRLTFVNQRHHFRRDV